MHEAGFHISAQIDWETRLKATGEIVQEERSQF